MGSTRRRLLERTAAIAGIVGLAVAGGWTQAQSMPASEANTPPLPSPGSRLRLPEVTLLDGRVFKPAQANAQVLVVYWWASWCPFCALQSPAMEKLWREQRARGLQMLALSIDKKREDATTYLNKKGYTFPVGMVTPEVARIMPKPRGLPVTLVRGRDGRVLMVESGQMFPEDVAQIGNLL